MFRFPPPLAVLLFPVFCHAADPVISEFMASNQNGARDRDGDRPDWIEIHNPGETPVSLSGWTLTDNPANPRKWAFPDITLPGNGHLLVFASGKDRRAAGAEPHANFSLSAGGEYLALVKPDGGKSSEWSPAYPPQFPDISYGAASNTSSVAYVRSSTPVRATVPSDDSLMPRWRALEFDDTSWTEGLFAVGYYNNTPQQSLGIDFGPFMSGTGLHSYTRARFSVEQAAAVRALTLRVNYDDGFIAWINGARVAASPGAPDGDAVSITDFVPNHNAGVFEEFPLPAGALAALRDGENVLALECLNTNFTSSDASVSAQLSGSVTMSGPGQTGYFSTATPGAANGGTETLHLPETVTLSHPPGVFTEPFALTLGGAAPGREIRYVMSDAASRVEVPEPSPSSALYTEPLSITETTVVRAAVFEGELKSRAVTAHYLRVANGPAGFSSILPVLVLDDHGAGRPVDSGSNSWTPSALHIFEPVNGTARLVDPAAGRGAPSVFSRAGVRVRGSSSAGFPKKSYGLELWDEQNADRDLPLLGMAAESDWILNGPYAFDKTFIHNAFIYELSRRAGRWAPRTRPCEVFFHQSGGIMTDSAYDGVYILTEKIKSKNERLDIAGLKPEHTSGANLTGGYIFKIDRADSGEFAWTIDNSAFGLGWLPNQESGQSLVIVEPDPDEDTAEQREYLRNYVNTFNDTLFAERAAGFATRTYRNYIDVPSFIDHHILNSLAYNVDALRLSAFYHKDRNGKINAGPLWDFDRALGSGDRDGSPASWNNIEYYFDRDWWGGLFRDPLFVQEWVDRWRELRQPGGVFDLNAMRALADEMGAEIGNAAGARDAAVYPENRPSGGVYLNAVNAMKTWLNSRVSFLDGRVPAEPYASLESGPATAGTTVTLTGSGPIRYTLDGSDPRPSDGSTPGSGTLYSGPVTLNATTVLTARRQGNFTPFPQGAASISWSAPLKRVYLVEETFAAPGDLAVSEIHYRPLAPEPAELALAPGATAEDFEWIELRNTGAGAVNTFEMAFPAGYPFEKELRLKPKTLAPGERALVVRNRAAFLARYGVALEPKIVGEWKSGTLSDNGEEIRLLTRDGAAALTFEYQSGEIAGWPGRADGKGAALEYTGATSTTGDYQNPENWRSSPELHGSPGVESAGPDRRAALNEILANTDGAAFVDAIELRNNGAEPLDLGGAWLSDIVEPETAADYRKFRIPDGTVVPAGGHVTFTEEDFHPNGAWNPEAGTPGPGEFALDGLRGGELWLLTAAAGAGLRFADHVEFGPLRLNESLGRVPDGAGDFRALAARSLLDETNATVSPRPGLGAANGGARAGPVLIQEIQHGPPDGNAGLQFVEILNSGAEAVSLDFWRLRGDADYNFTMADSLTSGGVLVVVPFSPDDAEKAAAFRAAYGIDETVKLAGPWNAGDTLKPAGEVTLYRAEPALPENPYDRPRTVEDATRYQNNLAGWPDSASGASLNRKTAADGFDPVNWRAAPPTPGDMKSVILTYETWKRENGHAGAGAEEDRDGDGLGTLLEYALDTDPRTLDTGSAALLPRLTTRSTAEGGAEFLFNWTRAAERAGLTCQAETSEDLKLWTPVESIPLSLEGDRATYQAALELPSTGRRFVRLKITVEP